MPTWRELKRLGLSFQYLQGHEPCISPTRALISALFLGIGQPQSLASLARTLQSADIVETDANDEHF